MITTHLSYTTGVLNMKSKRGDVVSRSSNTKNETRVKFIQKPLYLDI